MTAMRIVEVVNGVPVYGRHTALLAYVLVDAQYSTTWNWAAGHYPAQPVWVPETSLKVGPYNGERSARLPTPVQMVAGVAAPEPAHEVPAQQLALAEAARQHDRQHAARLERYHAKCDGGPELFPPDVQEVDRREIAFGSAAWSREVTRRLRDREEAARIDARRELGERFPCQGTHPEDLEGP